MKFTENQQKAIDIRGGSVLVGAAAGSGKTAVLTQRVISLLTDRDNPIDADSLLIVTFTNAAASSMRDKIVSALDKAISDNPDDTRLHRQKALLRSARICTIDSFCQSVIRNGFYLTGADPASRIASESEVLLLKEQAADELIEAMFEEGSSKFYDFALKYGSERSNDKLKSLIIKLYDYAASYADMEGFMEKFPDVYDNAPFIDELLEDIKSSLSDIAAMEFSALKICEQGGVGGYVPVISDEIEFFKSLLSVNDFWECGRLLKEYKFARLSPAKDADPDAKEMAKGFRNKAKKAKDDLTAKWFFSSKEMMESHMKNAKETAIVLRDLEKSFLERYEKLKKDACVMDFSDLEHEAVKILIGEDGQPSRVAASYAEQFYEIMVDEYQDTNYVQESIINAVSGGEKSNIFMVGDVKQSIYGFRQARPSLFMEKYDNYATGNGGRRVILSANFRSRQSVITSINDLFVRIMKKELGGIAYDADASLKYGGLYNNPDTKLNKTQILITEGGADGEAAMVAAKIHEMLYGESPYTVQDKDTGELRLIKPGDIAILLRSASDSDVFADALGQYGIGSFTPSKKGYFSAPEIKVMLAFLSIIDNPRQDIPFAAVLKSDMYGFTSPELSKIRIEDRQTPFYEAALKYAKEGKDENLKERLNRFFKDLDELRNLSLNMKVRELIEEILDRTGFDSICATDAMGVRKSMNLHMLMEKALEYENSSYAGIFDFNRYINELRSYEVDYGQAPALDSMDEVVGIYTIHKSKGLEYPVVFVSQCLKQFNKSDLRASVVADDRYGVGLDDIDLEMGTRVTTLPMTYIKHRADINYTAEELRVLYVALTRAMEKLIITGASSKAEELYDNYISGNLFESTVYDENDALTSMEILGAKSFMDWILKGYAYYGNKYELKYIKPDELNINKSNIRSTQTERFRTYKDISQKADEKDYSDMEAAFAKYEASNEDIRIPAKFSVSQIKLYEMESADEEAFDTFSKREISLYEPCFGTSQKTPEKGPAAYGTAVHRVLELLDFSKTKDFNDLKESFIRFREDELMTEESLEMVHPGYFSEFIKSGLFERMKEADIKGELFKEKSFVMSIPANEASPELPKDSDVLVQGIIDAYFTENGKVYIVDYKTDRVDNANELTNRYNAQMKLYARALGRALDTDKISCILYSFYLNESIELAEFTDLS